MLRLPIEYFAGWFFYDLFLLLTTIVSLGYSLKTESKTNDAYKVMDVLIITIWFFMIPGLAGDSLGSSYAASEDAGDVMILSLEGHLFKSTHAPHYDLAPMHTFLYVITSQILGLQLVPQQNTYAWELITISLLTFLFLAFGSFIDLIETYNHEREKLLKLLVLILLTIHPCSWHSISISSRWSFWGS
jgi:steroid 5-alpha reductase family enzyme